VDDQRLNLASAAQCHLASITLPGSLFLWLIGPAATSRVKDIRPDDLRRLLGDLEASGRHSAHDLGDYQDPFVGRLRVLGIESIDAVTPKPATRHGDGAGRHLWQMGMGRSGH